MFCIHCGSQLKPENKFCTICGKLRVTKDDASKKIEDKISTLTHGASLTIASVFKNIWASQNRNGWKRGIIIVGGLIVGIIALVSLFGKGNSGSTTPINNSQAVVDILCDNGLSGSGTIFTPDGTVLTNNHVIAGATVCKITIPDPITGKIAEIYNAAPIIVPILSQQYDVATLKIDGSFTDASGTTWGAYPTTFSAFTLPSACSTSTPSQLNDSVRIYGYPVTSGGLNLTVTDGIISSFADNGEILTSAKVDSGNSGGLAVDQNGCWLGIPSAVVSGNYQNLGVIIPGSVVKENFLASVPAKYEPIAVSSGTDAFAPLLTSQETNDQACQTTFGTYSQYAGKTNSNGQPLCGCQNGYSWNGSGKACATQISLQQYCQNQYGPGSYSSPKNGKAVCGCSEGYVWNSDQTICVIPQKTNEQKCQDQYGVYSEWSGQFNSTGQPTCNCQSGYAWDGTGNVCTSQTSLDQSCQSTFGLGSYSYTKSGKAVCDCGTGYTWNSDQTACTAVLTPNQICQRDVGGSSYYLGYKNSDGTYACSSAY